MKIEYKSREDQIQLLMRFLSQIEEGRAVLRPLAEQKLQEAIDKGQLESITLDGEECFISKSFGALDVVRILRKGPATLEEITQTLDISETCIKWLLEIGNYGCNVFDRMFEKTKDGHYVLLNDPEFEENK